MSHVDLEAAVLTREASEQLEQRLLLMSLQPKVILNCSSRNSWDSSMLKQRFPHATIIEIDATDSLSLAAHSVDFIYANLTLTWEADIKKIFSEWQRLLSPNGLFLFSFLGLKTFANWDEKIKKYLLPHLKEMHEVGDLLTQSKFADPVLDVGYLTLNYRDKNKLHQELLVTNMLQADAPENLFELEEACVRYEIVYAHAWGRIAAKEQVADEFGVVRFPLENLKM